MLIEIICLCLYSTPVGVELKECIRSNKLISTGHKNVRCLV